MSSLGISISVSYKFSFCGSYLLEQIPQFELASDFEPTGDQPQAIDALVEGVKKGAVQTLLGVTGSGKTFSVANVIARTGKTLW